MRPEALKRFAAAVPRYTSYPTAPHFSPKVDAATYDKWLGAIPDGQPLSLYLHIPFCDTLCWYCGCATKITQRYEPIQRYIDVLDTEIARVAARLKGTFPVAHIHFGGGSPSIMSPADITRIAARLRSSFQIAPNAEFAVEIDPRGIPEERIDAFAKAGVNRVSIGVQDFDERVQRAINREQSFETTARVVRAFRDHGIESINIDLVYGLPHQTRDSVEDTIEHVIALRPDRIALFGYAHIPSRMRHQRLIDEEVLPDTTERYAQANRAADSLVAAGYVRVGLDHFALPGDSLASGKVQRNFQGYTSDTATTLIGLGASSIGRLPQGYVQNAPAIGDYERRIEEGGLATVRGHAMTPEDEARGFTIERLMCDFRFPAAELKARFGVLADPILLEAESFMAADDEGLVAPLSGGEGFEVTPKGRLFVRSICAVFDSYFGRGEARHSAGV